jgi:hypothetical protein
MANLSDLVSALDVLKREVEALRIMADFLPDGDPFVAARTENLEEQSVGLLLAIKRAEDDLGKAG